MMLLALKANGIIEALAAAYDGEVTLRMGPLSPYPEMSFFHARKRVFVDLVTRDDAERVTVTMPAIPGPRMRLFDIRLFQRRRFDWFLRLFGFRDPRVREMERAGLFCLGTSDPGKLAYFFREAAAYRLRELALMPFEGELAVAWTPTRFLLQKPVIEFALDGVRAVVAHALKLIELLEDDSILPFTAPGESVLPEPVVRTGGVVWDPIVGSCRVCGEGLQGRVVYCVSCSTPHHPDCWQYAGQCAVYACGAKKASERMGTA